MKRIVVFLIPVLFIILHSCKEREHFEIKDFSPISNFNVESDTLSMQMDLSDAVAKGVIIPSNNGDDNYFIIKFKIRNNGDKPKRFFYKVFYQNESYKYNEFILDKGIGKKVNTKANENFYGSWNDSNLNFHITDLIPCDNKFYEISDSIRIVGNPRNEVKYFGGEAHNFTISEEEIQKMYEKMRNTPVWMKQMKEKSEKRTTSCLIVPLNSSLRGSCA